MFALFGKKILYFPTITKVNKYSFKKNFSEKINNSNDNKLSLKEIIIVILISSLVVSEYENYIYHSHINNGEKNIKNKSHSPRTTPKNRSNKL